MNNTSIAIWRDAEAIDETLRLRPSDWRKLERIRVRPVRFSLATLHRQMEMSEPVVFRDCPVAIKGPEGPDPLEGLTQLILTGFQKRERARARTGRGARIKLLDIPEVMRRWVSGKSLVNVTDLHIRGTNFERGVDSSVLTDSNILLGGSSAIARQELFTLLITAKGAMSDSHSDDPDGSNHCFIGKKLWLAWDTFEGKKNGLEDVSRDICITRAKFTMGKFLSLKSARWFTVEKNQTLFLPGRMTHKVITLEPYIGIGCFYVTIPNCLGTLARWYRYGPLWSLDSKDNASLVDEIAATTIKIIQALRVSPIPTRNRYGFNHLKRAAKRFETEVPRSERLRLLKNPAFAQLVDLTGDCWRT